MASGSLLLISVALDIDVHVKASYDSQATAITTGQEGIAMQTYQSTISSKGQITLPADVRRHLGLEPADKVSVVVTEDGRVELRRPIYTLASLRGSLPALPNQSEDFEREIEEAMEERAAEVVRRLKEG